MSDTDQESAPNSDEGMTNRQRIVLLVGMIAVLGALGAVYLAWAGGRESANIFDREEAAQAAIRDFEDAQPTATPRAAIPPAAPEPTVIAEAPPGEAPQPGEVLVVNRVPGEDYGRLAVRHADGTRTLLDRTCLRVHIAAERGACVGLDGGLVPSYLTTFFPTRNPSIGLKAYPSALPSRVRLSPDGSVSSITAFLTGSSYADISSDTTTLVTIDDIDGEQRLRSAQQFAVNATEPRFANASPQYWGMTFANENDFYITGFFGTAPEIMQGSLDDMTIEPTGWIGSCPSLSPDGKTLVFKEQRQDGGFDLVAVDVATQEKRPLGEARSVDDQVEWLDNDTILYALHPDGGDKPVQPEFDIWMLDIAPGSEPVLFLPNADSPAVAR